METSVFYEMHSKQMRLPTHLKSNLWFDAKITERESNQQLLKHVSGSLKSSLQGRSIKAFSKQNECADCKVHSCIC